MIFMKRITHKGFIEHNFCLQVFALVALVPLVACGPAIPFTDLVVIQSTMLALLFIMQSTMALFTMPQPTMSLPTTSPTMVMSNPNTTVQF